MIGSVLIMQRNAIKFVNGMSRFPIFWVHPINIMVITMITSPKLCFQRYVTLKYLHSKLYKLIIVYSVNIFAYKITTPWYLGIGYVLRTKSKVENETEARLLNT